MAQNFVRVAAALRATTISPTRFTDSSTSHIRRYEFDPFGAGAAADAATDGAAGAGAAASAAPAPAAAGAGAAAAAGAAAPDEEDEAANEFNPSAYVS